MTEDQNTRAPVELLAWLVEWPEDDNVPVRWWHCVNGWMRDANKATRFSRKEDAEGFIASSRVWGVEIKATEHKWFDTRAPVDQPDFDYFECPECGFSSVQRADFKGSEACPLCAGDSGHDVGMRRRTCVDADKPEGRDARKVTP